MQQIPPGPFFGNAPSQAVLSVKILSYKRYWQEAKDKKPERLHFTGFYNINIRI